VNVAGDTTADPVDVVTATDPGTVHVVPLWLFVTGAFVIAFASSPRISDMILTVDKITAVRIEPNMTTPNCII
jgi:hypothetical protein